MEIEEFRKNLLRKFTERKVFEKIRLELRSYVIKELFENKMYSSPPEDDNLSSNVAELVNALLINHLQTMNLELSCSVLIPEAAIPFYNPRKTNEYLKNCLNFSPTDGKSFLFALCEKLGSNTSTVGVQTENKLSFEQKLRIIEDKYRYGEFHNFSTMNVPGVAFQPQQILIPQQNSGIKTEEILQEVQNLRKEISLLKSDIEGRKTNQSSINELHVQDEMTFLPTSRRQKCEDAKNIPHLLKNIETKSSRLESRVRSFLYSSENDPDDKSFEIRDYVDLAKQSDDSNLDHFVGKSSYSKNFFKSSNPQEFEKNVPKNYETREDHDEVVKSNLEKEQRSKSSVISDEDRKQAFKTEKSPEVSLKSSFISEGTVKSRSTSEISHKSEENDEFW